MRWVTTLRTRRHWRTDELPRRVRRFSGSAGSTAGSRPIPQFEVWVDGVLIAILDLANPELWYAAEYDGEEWHSSQEQRDHDRPRREADREARIRRRTPSTRQNVFGAPTTPKLLLVGAAAPMARRHRVYL